mgnify:CR=1 FL=1
MDKASLHRARKTALLAALLAAPFWSTAKASACCPTDPNTKPAASGMGLSAPLAADVSGDSAWHVYPFERDGIPYLQVNDLNGIARIAVGYADGVFWALPIGTDKVSTPLRPITAPAGSTRTVVYRSPDIEVAVYVGGGTVLWSVAKPTP